jgi:hypothetical protein
MLRREEALQLKPQGFGNVQPGEGYYTPMFICRRIPTCENKNYKETVVSARRLLQYFQLPDKNSRDIPRYFFFAVFQNSYAFSPLFVAEPLTMFAGTLFEKDTGGLGDRPSHGGRQSEWKCQIK